MKKENFNSQQPYAREILKELMKHIKMKDKSEAAMNGLWFHNRFKVGPTALGKLSEIRAKRARSIKDSMRKLCDRMYVTFLNI